MTEALVEKMIDNICKFNSSFEDLFDMLQTNLDDADGVIVNGQRHETTATVYGSEDQIGLMKRMWDVIQQEPTERDTILQIGADAEAAGEGPLFFRVMVIVYKWWIFRWSEENAVAPDDGDTDDGDSDDGDWLDTPGAMPHEDAFAMTGGADMGALLSKLEGFGAQ